MCSRDRRIFLTPVAVKHRGCPAARVGVLCAAAFASALFAGCGELEPLREPEVVDLELATDTLKVSVRDAQRMVAELRADLEVQRRELAEAQVARAQLEGRVREAERRVAESRRVIELQREELAAARTERAHLSRNSLYLQGQLKRLQKQLSGAGKSGPSHDGQEAVPLRSSSPIHKGQKAMQVSAQRNQPSEFPEMPQVATTSVAAMPMLANRKPSLEVEQSMDPTKYIYVKPGDTLWSIAQKYRVRLEDLRIINQLTDNRIIIGQTLWLPDDRAPMSGVVLEKGASRP
ncbi:MAG TPA: LysM peptidoglycan-binding domain-containing protein [Nitrospiraceae bacterium]|nr:LysM peptidoglycan-binding domain-containing protein [Nitrospiraceae bacterium]